MKVKTNVKAGVVVPDYEAPIEVKTNIHAGGRDPHANATGLRPPVCPFHCSLV